MGKLNHTSQMCPFMNIFKHPLNKVLAHCIANGTAKLPEQAIVDLQVWTGFIRDTATGIPLPHPDHPPPMCTKTFTSDAAGLPKNSKWESNIGCGVIGVDEIGDTMFVTQLWWPKDFITHHKDSKGCAFGNKTTTLELVGVLLPFLTIPNLLKNQHIVSRVNMACIFGFRTDT